MAQLHHESKLNYKLGPSDELHAAEKLLKSLKLVPKRLKTSAKSKSVAKTK